MHEAAAKMEGMIRSSRLNDLNLLMKSGLSERLAEIEESLSKLDPGAYLVGCGPYTQGIYKISCSEVVFGRNATIHEDSVGVPVDFTFNDAATFRPREISRVHFRINCEDMGGEVVYFVTDLGSSCGTYLNGTLLESQTDRSSERDTRVSKPLADQDIISMGPSMVNLLMFLVIAQE